MTVGQYLYYPQYGTAKELVTVQFPYDRAALDEMVNDPKNRSQATIWENALKANPRLVDLFNVAMTGKRVSPDRLWVSEDGGSLLYFMEQRVFLWMSLSETRIISPSIDASNIQWFIYDHNRLYYKSEDRHFSCYPSRRALLAKQSFALSVLHRSTDQFRQCGCFSYRGRR